MYGIIDLKAIKIKQISLVILMILAISLLTGDTTIIVPSILFTGIISGVMNNDAESKVLLNSLIAFLLGSLLAIIVSLVNVYYTEGALYAISIIQYSWIFIIFYTFIGMTGALIGYHLQDELQIN